MPTPSLSMAMLSPLHKFTGASLLLLLTFSSVGQTAGLAPLSGDSAHGKLIFQQSCVLCHADSLGPRGEAISKQGPSLVGVIGRGAASLPNFGYTQALEKSGLVWDASALDRYLANPGAVVPGTSMPIPTPKAADRADLIAYLSTLKAPEGKPAVAKDQPATTPDTADWRLDAPGKKHFISADSLPAPYGTSSAGNSPRVVARPAGAEPAVPAGFKVRLFADGLKGPRLLRVAPNGDIFIAETGARRIRVLRAADGAESPSENVIFADGLDRPFGLAFYPAGENPQWLYVANNNAVVRIPYHNGELKARGEPQVVVPQLTESRGGHSTRDIAFSNDGSRMFISVGSQSNVAEGMSRKSPVEIRAWENEHGRGAAWEEETNRALILVTDPEGKAPLRTFATGIRNGVGLAVNPTTGDLWTATNERDALGDNLVPDYITRVKEGGYYGWPWYYLGNHEDPRHAGARPDLAGQAIVPDILLQSHSAALEMTFYTATAGPALFPAEYHGDVFAALHGSWNRGERTGYKIVRVKLKAGVPVGGYEDFLTGFVVDNRSVWGRPVGVTVAHDGALLVTDDGNGTLWCISYEGK